MIMHPDELPHIRERHSRRLAGKQVSNHYETRIVHKDGRVVPTEVSSSKTMWQGQAVVMAIVRDITERKRMEAGLARAHDELEQRVEARTLELMEAA